jgi:3-oxoacyl-[acyl-carrier-protein] synthase-1
LGIVCSLGNNKSEVLESLKEVKSGIEFSEIYADMGLRSHVHGSISEIDTKDVIDRKMLRFMADAAIFNAIALDEAIKQSELSEEMVSHERTGLIMGSGGASNVNVIDSADILREKGIKRVGPYRVPRAMGSTTSACLSTLFKIKGINYSISSACSTSAHCIGNAMEQIQMGKQDVVFAGGGEEGLSSALLLASSELCSSSDSEPELLPSDCCSSCFLFLNVFGLSFDELVPFLPPLFLFLSF